MTEPTTASLPPEDESAIRAIIAHHIDAWARHDMDGVVADMAEDVVFINVVGMVWQGRERVRAAHDWLHRTMFANSRLTPGGLDLRPVAPGMVIGISRTGIEGAGSTPDGRPYPGTESIMTLVFAKDGDRWRIVHAHNTNVDARAAAHDPAHKAAALAD